MTTAALIITLAMVVQGWLAVRQVRRDINALKRRVEVFSHYCLVKGKAKTFLFLSGKVRGELTLETEAKTWNHFVRRFFFLDPWPVYGEWTARLMKGAKQ